MYEGVLISRLPGRTEGRTREWRPLSMESWAEASVSVMASEV